MDALDFARIWLTDWDDWETAYPVRVVFIHRPQDDTDGDPEMTAIPLAAPPDNDYQAVNEYVAYATAYGFDRAQINPIGLLAVGYAIDGNLVIGDPKDPQLRADAVAKRVHTRADRQHCMQLILRPLANDAPVINWAKVRSTGNILTGLPIYTNQADFAGIADGFARHIRQQIARLAN